MHVIVDGILTNYQVVGDKEKTILILHGWQRSLSEWLPVAKQLSEKYKVVLLDLPGFGQTARPETTYSIYDYAAFTEHFLDKLDISKVTLMGHSFGGRIGIILAAKTDRLEELILVDAAAVEKRTTAAKMKIAFFKTAKVFFPKSFVNRMKNRIGSADYVSAGAMREIFLKVINEDLTYLLPKVHVPAFIIWGEKDTEVPAWKTKVIKTRIPQTKLRVVWGAGHSPYLEKPKDFMEILGENI